MRVGDPLAPETQLGPVVSSEQLDRISGFLELGKQQGARTLSGGERITEGSLGKGFYIAPTVFADVNDNMRIAREEIFGPVLALLPWHDEADLLAQCKQLGGVETAGRRHHVSRASHQVRNGVQAAAVRHRRGMDNR